MKRKLVYILVLIMIALGVLGLSAQGRQSPTPPRCPPYNLIGQELRNGSDGEIVYQNNSTTCNYRAAVPTFTPFPPTPTP